MYMYVSRVVFAFKLTSIAVRHTIIKDDNDEWIGENGRKSLSLSFRADTSMRSIVQNIVALDYGLASFQCITLLTIMLIAH